MQSNEQVALVFVHGLGGSPKTTWSEMAALLKKTASTRRSIKCYYYQYPTRLWRMPFFGKYPNIQTLSAGLNTQIKHEIGESREIILVCHSLGGLVAKQYLIDQIREQSSVTVRNIVLYAVPNNGASLARVGNTISWRHNQLKQLCRNSDFLHAQQRDWKYFNIESIVKATYVVGGADKVVDLDSARGAALYETFEVAVDKGHLNIVKPKNKNDVPFVVLRDIIADKLPKAKLDDEEATSESGNYKVDILGPSIIKPRQRVNYYAECESTARLSWSYTQPSDLSGRKIWIELGHSGQKETLTLEVCHEDGKIITVSKDIEAV